MVLVSTQMQDSTVRWYEDSVVSETKLFSSTSLAEPAPNDFSTNRSGIMKGDTNVGQECGTGKSRSEEIKCSRNLGPWEFNLLACVGVGGYGTVYQCRKKGTDEIFAMKVLEKSASARDESNILRKVAHPFIVKLHHAFETRTRCYLLFDFINGGELLFHLQKQTMFTEEVAQVYFAEMVCAVAYLHEKSIIHRDLKPDNILLDADGHVQIADFGLAREVNHSTRLNSLCGNRCYRSPEMILGMSYGKPADWWSLGIVLYEMLTGKPPYDHENQSILNLLITQNRLKPPTYLTEDAISLLKGLLQKDPKKRLGSGREGADEIKRHKWFRSIDWGKAKARNLQLKFRPTVTDKYSIANFENPQTNVRLLDSLESTPELEDLS